MSYGWLKSPAIHIFMLLVENVSFIAMVKMLQESFIQNPIKASSQDTHNIEMPIESIIRGLRMVEKSIHVIFYETNNFSCRKDDDDVQIVSPNIGGLNLNGGDTQADEESNDLPLMIRKILPFFKDLKYMTSLPQKLIIGEPLKEITTRSSLNKIFSYAFVS